MTNQTAVGKGLLPESTLNEVIHPAMRRMLHDEAGASIGSILYAIKPRDVPCDRRKPAPGMLLAAAAAVGAVILVSAILVGIAEGLVSRGHQVSVVCAFPHHERGTVDERYHGQLTSREERNGVQIYRAYIKEGGDGLKGKLLNYGSFTASALWASLRFLCERWTALGA